MNFRQIEIFKAVMETGTVTGAARRLHISQPAVSKLLGQFERDLGFSAFDRVKGRLVPTAEARALFSQIERAYQGLDYLNRFAQDLREMRNGHLILGVMPALSARWMPTVVARFLHQHADLTVSLLTRNSSKVMEWVADQQVDVGIALLTIDDPMVHRETLWEYEAVCVVPTDHRLAEKSVIEARDLEDEPFISLSSLDHSRQIIDQVFQKAGVRRRLQVDTVFSSTACALVTEGVGVSLVDPMTAAQYTSSGLVACRFQPRVTFNIQLLRPLHRPRAQVVDNFIEHLKKCVEETVESGDYALP